MLKKTLAIILIAVASILVFVSCGHEHEWSEWQIVKAPTTTEKGLEERICTCGEKESRDIEKLPIDTTVDFSEWSQAYHNLSKYSKIVVQVEEISKDTDYPYSVIGTFTFDIDSGTAAMEYIWKDDDGEETINEFDDNCSVSSFRDITVSDLTRELWYYIDDEMDLSYSKFTYNNETSSYYTTIDSMLTNIYFEEGKIVKITFDSETLNAEYIYQYN